MPSIDPARYGRHRARHPDAAPDPYVDDDAWWRDAPPSRDDRDGYDRDAYDRDAYDRDAYDHDAYDHDAFYPADDHDGYRDPEPAPEPEPRTAPPTRAGRNLPAAIGVGVTLGAAVIAALLFWRPAFLAVIIVAMGIGTWEMSRAVRANGARPPLVPLLVGGAVMCGLAWYAGPSAAAVGLLVTILTTLVWRLADGAAGYHRDAMAATLIAVYVPYLGSFAALLAAPADGAKRVLIMLVSVVLSDTGGYVAGVFFGKHPMAPSVSPKKSWEGLVGSVIATAAGGALLLYFLLDVAWWWGLVFGVAIAAAGVLGDLAESLVKRDLGIKDMSRLLPGHGGLMDRLDSILFAAPVAYLLLSVLASTT